MTRLPRVTAERAARVLERHGYIVIRQSGSHRIYRNSVGVRVTLPLHSGRVLHPRLMKALLEDTGIDATEF